VTWFRALGDPSRSVIVNLLATAGRAMTVGEIVSELDLAQSTVSLRGAATQGKRRPVLLLVEPVANRRGLNTARPRSPASDPREADVRLIAQASYRIRLGVAQGLQHHRRRRRTRRHL